MELEEELERVVIPLNPKGDPILEAGSTHVYFRGELNVELIRGVAQGEHVLQILMPWNLTYVITTNKDEDFIKDNFASYKAIIERKATIAIHDDEKRAIIYMN